MPTDPIKRLFPMVDVKLGCLMFRDDPGLEPGGESFNSGDGDPDGRRTVGSSSDGLDLWGGSDALGFSGESLLSGLDNGTELCWLGRDCSEASDLCCRKFGDEPGLELRGGPIGSGVCDPDVIGFSKDGFDVPIDPIEWLISMVGDLLFGDKPGLELRGAPAGDPGLFVFRDGSGTLSARLC